MGQPALFGDESGWARAVRLVLTLLLCAHFTLLYTAEPAFLDTGAYIAGNALTPYQYRVLPMLLMRALDGLGPVVALAHRLPLRGLTPPALVTAALALLSMLLAVYITGKTITRLTADPSAGRWFALLVPVVSYPVLCSTWGLRYALPYDVPSLAIFAVGLWLIVTRRTLWLLALMLIGTLNRETTIFLVPFLGVWIWRGPAREGLHGKLRSMALVVPLVMVWAAVKWALERRFHANAAEGGHELFTHHIAGNLHAFAAPWQWPVLASVTGFTLPLLWMARRYLLAQPASNVFAEPVSNVSAEPASNASAEPAFNASAEPDSDAARFTAAATVTAALWLAGMMIVGVVVELRVFTEWAAMAVPLVAVAAVRRVRTLTEQAAGQPALG